MLQVLLHQHAQEDIQRLLKIDQQAAQRVLAIIQEMSSCVEVNDGLTNNGWQLDDLEVKQWWTQYNLGHDVYRIRCLNKNDASFPYRIIYAFYAAGPGRRKPLIMVLAVAPRSFNYETGNSITQRINKDYDDQ